MSQDIVPLTTTQGTIDWFECQRLSLLSSTVSNMIEVRAKEIKFNDPATIHYSLVLCAVNCFNWLVTSIDLNDTDNNQNRTLPQPPPDNVAERNATAFLDKINNYNTVSDQHNLEQDAIDIITMNTILQQFKFSKTGTNKKTLKKDINLFINLKSLRYWKYNFNSKAELVQVIVQTASTISTIGNKDSLIQRIADYEKMVKKHENKASCNLDPYGDDDIDPIFEAMVSSTFMLWLGAKQEKYCRKGYENERPFCEQFYSHSKESKKTCD